MNFPYKIIHQSEYEALQNQIDSLRVEKHLAEEALKAYRAKDIRPRVDLNAEDPDLAQLDRQSYVYRVALFFKEVLDRKLEYWIAQNYKALGQVTNSQRYDDVIKGTINAFWIIYDWGDLMQKEYVAYLEDTKQEATESPPADAVAEAFNNISNAIK